MLHAFGQDLNQLYGVESEEVMGEADIRRAWGKTFSAVAKHLGLESKELAAWPFDLIVKAVERVNNGPAVRGAVLAAFGEFLESLA